MRYKKLVTHLESHDKSALSLLEVQYKSYEQEEEEAQSKPLLFQSPAPAVPDPLFYAQLSLACGSH